MPEFSPSGSPSLSVDRAIAATRKLVLKQLDFIQLTLPETRLHSFSSVRRRERNA